MRLKEYTLPIPDAAAMLEADAGKLFHFANRYAFLMIWEARQIVWFNQASAIYYHPPVFLGRNTGCRSERVNILRRFSEFRGRPFSTVLFHLSRSLKMKF